MANYIFAYHGGTAPSTPEEGHAVMRKWTAWFESIGPSVVDGGNPVGKSQTVHPDKSVSDDGGSNPLSGYSIIKADNPAAAAELAQGCPILEEGGSIEIAPVVEM